MVSFARCCGWRQAVHEASYFLVTREPGRQFDGQTILQLVDRHPRGNFWCKFFHIMDVVVGYLYHGDCMRGGGVGGVGRARTKASNSRHDWIAHFSFVAEGSAATESSFFPLSI